MIAFLPAHLGDDALDVRLAVGRVGGALDDVQTDRAGAGEGDHVHAWVLDQRGAGVAEAGHEREHAVGQAVGVQRLPDVMRRQRRLLGRLEDDRVSGGEPRGGQSPSGIASGKFQGAITATTPRGT